MIGDFLFAGWPVVGSLIAGVGSVALGAYINQYRGKPGVTWFVGVFAAQAIWCLSYGLALMTYQSPFRQLFELLVWIGIIWTGITFFGFALEYSGRGQVIQERLFRSFIAFGVLSTLIVFTNSYHGLVVIDLQQSPLFGVATATYTFGIWAYVIVSVCTVAVASGVFLLVDTFISYGPLYRRETAAVALSALPPGLGLLVWMFELGPVPELNLAPIFFIPHLLLDMYAFGRAEMFEQNPTTMRAAERSVIDDIDDPILILSSDCELVRLNPAAKQVLEIANDDVFGRPIDTVLNTEISESLTEQNEIDSITLGSRYRQRTYTVSSSELTDPTAATVGYTIVLSDITDREQRRQKLEVLNRILRHNLRNDATVVQGYGDLLADQLTKPAFVDMAESIEASASALARLGEKSDLVEDLVSDTEPSTVNLGVLIDDLVDSFQRDYPDARIERVKTESMSLTCRKSALRAVVENGIENALEHHDGQGDMTDESHPWVQISLTREPPPEDGATSASAMVVITIEDDGPGIPGHELNTVRRGTETQLEHGSGLGLWLITWGATALDATVDFSSRSPRGTTMTVRIPQGGDTHQSDDSPVRIVDTTV